ncbi:MAG: lipid II flippase MurJ, partial [Lancefieldella sp.]
PALKDTLKIGAPALIVVIANFITVSVQNSSQLSVSAAGGAISNYARLWYTLPYAILTVPLTTALFTELSDNWAKKNIAAFKRDLTQGICQILLFTVPFMLYLIVFSVPLISIISSRQFEAEDILLTAEFLSGLSLALPLYGVGMYLQKVCSAMRRMTLYAVAATLGSGVQVALLIFGTPYFGLGFVAATSAIFNVIIDIVMLLALRRRLGHIGLVSMAFAFVRSLGLGLLGSAVAVLIMRVLEAFIGPVIGSPLRGIINCFAAGIPAVLVTYGLAVICKFPEAAAIRSLLGRLRR